ncbi:MAG: fatty acid hydroxylase [Deltaproteobacteria bacterium]|nr:fatty acid hydroxylase [Deltaproteobacteria bacterium]
MADQEIPDGWSENGADSFRMLRLAFLPKTYRPVFHLLGPATVGSIAWIACAATLGGPSWKWILVPVLLVAANAFEWHAHRGFLHTLGKGRARRLYEDHTALHHRIYWSRRMALRDWRELQFILVPASAVYAMLGFNALIGVLIALTLDPVTARLFFMSLVAYALGYEWLHLSYHLPANHPIGRLGAIRWLARHHSIHHDPRIMRTKNMNVTVPLWDLVRGTMATSEESQRALGTQAEKESD